MRNCDSNNSTDTKVIKEGGGQGVSGAGAEITLQPLEKTTVKLSIPL